MNSTKIISNDNNLLQNISKEFIFASETVKKLAKKPDNEELLNLYGLYKKTTIGNINIDKPNILNFKEYGKWNAWNNCKFSNKEAEIEYIKLVNILIEKYEVNE